MRFIVQSLSTCALLACRAAPAPVQAAALGSSVEYLLTSAAADFHAHGPPALLRFRDVRSGYVMSPDGARRYRLCGWFSSAVDSGKAEWMPFVTIQTSGYEQYLGTQAAGFCAPSSLTWDTGDLSSSLQRRIDPLR